MNPVDRGFSHDINEDGAQRLPLAMHFPRAFELCPNENLAQSGL
jgi:hypothetical protein